MKKIEWMTGLKGLIVGATMIVPGISGGSMAMILGIYDRLISAISSFRKNVKGNLWFLVLFAVGAGMGMFFFASPLSWLLENYKMPAMYFFLGAVFGGIPMIEKKSSIQKFSWDVFAYIAAGAVCVMLFSAIPDSTFGTEKGNGHWLILLITGVISATALVLPGISISHFLLILGLYDGLLQAVRNFDFGFLLPMGAGLLLGIVLFSRFLEYAMIRYPKPTYLIILGFILGSAAEIFPGIPSGFYIFLCAGMTAAGFFSVYWISRQEI